MNKDELIFSELSKQKKMLEEKGYKVAYICLFGSQNYDLDLYTEEYHSDIDMKAIIVPTLDNLVYNSKPISTKIKFKYGEIDVKDIRVYMDTLSKVNPAYIEGLYTKYYIIDDEFVEDIEMLRAKSDDLVKTLAFFFVKAIYGMMMEKANAMCHPYPTIKYKIDKYGFDGKQSSHVIRLYNFMYDYFVAQKPLNECFIVNKDKELILKHKLNNISLNEAKDDMKKYISIATQLKDKITNDIDPNKIDYSVKSEFVNISRNIIKKHIVKSIKEGD